MSTTVQIFDAKLNVPAEQRHHSLKSLLLRQRHSLNLNRNILDVPFFEAKVGDRICIIGKNGNGKTTFLKVVSGIYPATSGRVWTRYKPTTVLASGIGLEDELTVHENIELALIIRGVSGKLADELKAKITDFCELEADSNKQFKHLSTGYRSRLAFAIATCEKPSILVLDEVLGGGDEFFMRRARAHVLEIIRSAETSFVCTHAPDDMLDVCNRCLVFSNGKITFDGNMQDGVAFYRKNNQ